MIHTTQCTTKPICGGREVYSRNCFLTLTMLLQQFQISSYQEFFVCSIVKPRNSCCGRTGILLLSGIFPIGVRWSYRLLGVHSPIILWRWVLVPPNKHITEHDVINELCALSFLLCDLNNIYHIATRSFKQPPFFRRCNLALFYFTFCTHIIIDNSSTNQMLLHSNHIWLSVYILYGNKYNYSMGTLLMPLQTLCSLVYNMYTEA